MASPCIISFYMNNIDPKTVQLQKAVVDKFNVSKVPHYQFLVQIMHGTAIDYFWTLNGERVHSIDPLVSQFYDHDQVLILDIDCIPLSERAIDYYLDRASAGVMIGNAQRTNHLQNNQHVFAAPSASALSKETFVKLGRPSAIETGRSDVLEEYTWNAERVGVPVEKIMPLRFAEAPVRYAWEGADKPPYWPLADGMPPYGIGTTYGDDLGELFYHQFQIRIPGQQEKFWKKCAQVLDT